MIITIDLAQTKTDDPEARQEAVKNLKILWATHHFLYVSPLADDIAEAVNVSPQKIHNWTKTPEWKQALKFWTGFDECHKQVDATFSANDQMRKQNREIRKTGEAWMEMIRRGDHITPPQKFEYVRNEDD